MYRVLHIFYLCVGSRQRLMTAKPKRPTRRLILSPEKSFVLPVYAEQIALHFEKFGCSKPKKRIGTYALNVFEFLDISASEGNETSESSPNDDSGTESTMY